MFVRVRRRRPCWPTTRPRRTADTRACCHCGSITFCDRPQTRSRGCGTASARLMPWARSLLLCLSTLPVSPAEPHLLTHRDLVELPVPPGSVGSLLVRRNFARQEESMIADLKARADRLRELHHA